MAKTASAGGLAAIVLIFYDAMSIADLSETEQNTGAEARWRKHFSAVRPHPPQPTPPRDLTAVRRRML
jgi:hypothetical protein